MSTEKGHALHTLMAKQPTKLKREATSSLCHGPFGSRRHSEWFFTKEKISQKCFSKILSFYVSSFFTIVLKKLERGICLLCCFGVFQFSVLFF